MPAKPWSWSAPCGPPPGGYDGPENCATRSPRRPILDGRGGSRGRQAGELPRRQTFARRKPTLATFRAECRAARNGGPPPTVTLQRRRASTDGSAMTTRARAGTPHHGVMTDAEVVPLPSHGTGPSRRGNRSGNTAAALRCGSRSPRRRDPGGATTAAPRARTAGDAFPGGSRGWGRPEPLHRGRSTGEGASVLRGHRGGHRLRGSRRSAGSSAAGSAATA